MSKEAKHTKIKFGLRLPFFLERARIGRPNVFITFKKNLFPFYNLFFLLVQGSLDYYWLSCMIYIKEARNDDRFFCSCITSSNR